MKPIVKLSEIIEEIIVCPYCMSEVFHNDMGCCGEGSSHFEMAYVLADETYLASQVEIVDDLH